MTTWRQTIVCDGLSFTSTEIVPLFMSLHVLVPTSLVRFEKRPDARFNLHVDAVDTRQWREILDLAVPPPGWTLDPGAIVGAWSKAEITALRPLRDTFVDHARSHNLTLAEFVFEVA